MREEGSEGRKGRWVVGYVWKFVGEEERTKWVLERKNERTVERRGRGIRTRGK